MVVLHALTDIDDVWFVLVEKYVVFTEIGMNQLALLVHDAYIRNDINIDGSPLGCSILIHKFDVFEPWSRCTFAVTDKVHCQNVQAEVKRCRRRDTSSVYSLQVSHFLLSPNFHHGAIAGFVVAGSETMLSGYIFLS